MKQKKIITLFAVAALLAACSSSDESPYVQEQQAGQQFTSGEVPVTFDTYVNRSTTRAGAYGENTITTLKATATTDGFGVFGYYTDNNDYDQFSIPNFMYNEKVTFDEGTDTWTYAPIKYWPNEHGASAISDDYDRVTFFAYAPYVNVAPSTGKIVTTGGDAAKNPNDATGIIGISSNTGSGDPMIKYVVSFDVTKGVDLLWGVKPDATTWALKEGGLNQTSLTTGMPWLNVQRPNNATGTQKLTFDFEHALAKLNVTVDAFVDGTSSSTEVAANNKIFIRSITFTGFATKGALNLNNSDAGAGIAKWMSFNGCAELETGDNVTIYDGRKDGKEGVSPASNEKYLGLNNAFIEDGDWTTVNVAAKGVTKTAQNLFDITHWPAFADPSNPTDEELTARRGAPIYVIPTTNDKVDVTIVYEVEAADVDLPTFLADGKTHGSRIKNTITKTNVFSGSLENGKNYTLKLHLGMNSVKFDAGVEPWEVAPGTEKDVNLPAN